MGLGVYSRIMASAPQRRAPTASAEVRNRFIGLLLIMVVACAAVMGVMTVILYQNNLRQSLGHLQSHAQSQARLIEAMARHDANMGDILSRTPSTYEADEATLSQVIDAHAHNAGMGRTGEVTLAHRKGDSIIFLLLPRHGQLRKPPSVRLDSELAEPMRRALAGRSGTFVGIDYRGEQVLAAHEPVGELDLGIVAKMDLAELRAPFIRAGLTAAAIALVFVLAGAILFVRVATPLVWRLQAHAKQLETEVEERKRAEKSLQDTVNLQLAIHQANPDLQFTLGSDQKIVGFHSNSPSDLHLPPEDFLGMRMQDVLPANLASRFDAAIAAALTTDGPQILEYPLISQDKSMGIWEARIVSLVNATGFVVLVRDITSRKNTEIERERLSLAIEHSSEAVVITDANTHIQYVNPAFEVITGYTKEDAIGATPKLFTSGRHDARFYEEMWAALNRGDTWKGSLVNRRKNGTLYLEETMISPVTDDAGNVVNYVAVKHDITHERELEEQLRHSSKMQALGTLSSGIAHDFNNILHGMRGYCDVARGSLNDDGSEVKECLDEIEAASQRASNVVRQLLTFSRAGEDAREPLYLGPVIKEAASLLKHALPSTVRVEFNIEACYPVLADPTQIHQVVVNLCTNAAHAMAQEGPLKVSIKNTTVTKDKVLSIGTLVQGDYVLLEVEDSGTGIPPEDLDRIFEPFFTTKAQGEGTGLGLSTVHGIVASMQGRVLLESTLGEGTKFGIYLPRCLRLPVISKQEAVAVHLDPTITSHVLVVDDEPAIVRVALRILQRRGFKADGFSDPFEAIKAFEDNPDRYCILVTDLTMPGLTGIELADQVHKIRPKLPILLISGRVEDEALTHVSLSEILCKPLGMHELVDAIQRHI